MESAQLEAPELEVSDVTDAPAEALTPRVDALLAKLTNGEVEHSTLFLEMVSLARALEEQLGAGPLGCVRLTGFQLQKALALAWPDSAAEPAQADAVVFLEELREGAAAGEDGEPSPAGLYLSFDDSNADPHLYNLPARDLDDCEICHGARGGKPGQELVIAGVTICKACHALTSD